MCDLGLVHKIDDKPFYLFVLNKKHKKHWSLEFTGGDNDDQSMVSFADTATLFNEIEKRIRLHDELVAALQFARNHASQSISTYRDQIEILDTILAKARS